MADGWRLAVGTLTAVPVRAPVAVTRSTARSAMLLAPLAVLPLGLLVAAAVGLAVLQVLAMRVHLSRGEGRESVMNVVLVVLAGVAAGLATSL